MDVLLINKVKFPLFLFIFFFGMYSDYWGNVNLNIKELSFTVSLKLCEMNPETNILVQ